MTWTKAIRFLGNNIWLIMGVLACVACMSCTHVPYSGDQDRPAVNASSFAPSGDLIVFSFSGMLHNGLFLMDRSGKVIKQLTNEPAGYWHVNPVFSPDGKKIAFVSYKQDYSDYGDIYIMDSDGKNLRQLTSTSDHDRNPRFSPDGSKIYFIRHDSWGDYPRSSRGNDYDSDIYYVNLDDGRVHQVTDQEFYRLYHMSVFPDGKHLLISTTAYVQQGYLLWKMSIADPKQVSPVEPNLTKFNPQPKYNYVNMYQFLEILYFTLSRDGKFLAFDWQNPLDARVGSWIGAQAYIVDMSNMQTTKLSSFKTNVGVRDISPDNKQVLFVSPSEMDYSNCCYFKHSNLWIVNRDGSGLRNISLDFSAIMKTKPLEPKPAQ